MKYHSKLVFLFALLLSGCVTNRIWDFPHLTGLAVDETGTPVSNATIERVDESNSRAKVGETDAYGFFDVVPLRHIAPFSASQPDLNGSFVIKKAGYQEVNIPYQVKKADIETEGSLPPQITSHKFVLKTMAGATGFR